MISNQIYFGKIRIVNDYSHTGVYTSPKGVVSHRKLVNLLSKLESAQIPFSLRHITAEELETGMIEVSRIRPKKGTLYFRFFASTKTVFERMYTSHKVLLTGKDADATWCPPKKTKKNTFLNL